eukprot:3901712-Rhodomonas_salina.2
MRPVRRMRDRARGIDLSTGTAVQQAIVDAHAHTVTLPRARRSWSRPSACEPPPTCRPSGEQTKRSHTGWVRFGGGGRAGGDSGGVCKAEAAGGAEGEAARGTEGEAARGTAAGVRHAVGSGGRGGRGGGV